MHDADDASLSLNRLIVDQKPAVFRGRDFGLGFSVAALPQADLGEGESIAPKVRCPIDHVAAEADRLHVRFRCRKFPRRIVDVIEFEVLRIDEAGGFVGQ